MIFSKYSWLILGKDNVKEAVAFGQLDDVKYHFEKASNDAKLKWTEEEKLFICAAANDQVRGRNLSAAKNLR